MEKRVGTSRRAASFVLCWGCIVFCNSNRHRTVFESESKPSDSNLSPFSSSTSLSLHSSPHLARTAARFFRLAQPTMQTTLPLELTLLVVDYAHPRRLDESAVEHLQRLTRLALVCKAFHRVVRRTLEGTVRVWAKNSSWRSCGIGCARQSSEDDLFRRSSRANSRTAWAGSSPSRQRRSRGLSSLAAPTLRCPRATSPRNSIQVCRNFLSPGDARLTSASLSSLLSRPWSPAVRSSSASPSKPSRSRRASPHQP